MGVVKLLFWFLLLEGPLHATTKFGHVLGLDSVDFMELFYGLAYHCYHWCQFCGMMWKVTIIAAFLGHAVMLLKDFHTVNSSAFHDIFKKILDTVSQFQASSCPEDKPKALRSQASSCLEGKQRAVSSRKRLMTEMTKKLEADCHTLRLIKDEKMEEINIIRKNSIELNYKIRATEEVLKWKQLTRERKEKELAAMEANVKRLHEETEKFKKETEATAEKLKQADFVHQLQIAQLEKKDWDSWILVCQMERELEEQRREAAYLQSRLQIVENINDSLKAMGEDATTWQNFPGKDSGPGTAPMSDVSSVPAKHAAEKGKVNVSPRTDSPSSCSGLYQVPHPLLNTVPTTIGFLPAPTPSSWDFPGTLATASTSTIWSIRLLENPLGSTPVVAVLNSDDDDDSSSL